MTSGIDRSNSWEAGSDALQKAYAAHLLTGFKLIIDDASPATLRQAEEAFAQAVLLDASRPEAYLGLALCHLDLGDPEHGLRYFNLCLEHGFGSGAYACLQYEHDDEDGETRAYDIGMDAVLIWRATCHLERGATEAAKLDLARLSDDPPLELRADLAVLRGRICLDKGDLAGAQRQLGEALAWDPDEADAHFLRGQLHERRGDPKAALRAYARAIRLDPAEPDFRIARASLLIEVGNPAKAEDDLTIAQRLLEAQSRQFVKLVRIERMRMEAATHAQRDRK